MVIPFQKFINLSHRYRLFFTVSFFLVLIFLVLIFQIAASHVQADSIIHFGHACLSKVTRLPVLYIFSRYDVDVDNFVERFKSEIPDKSEKVFIFYDVSYFHAIGETQSFRFPYTDF